MLCERYFDELPDEHKRAFYEREKGSNGHLCITYLYQIARVIADKYHLRMPAHKSIQEHCYKWRLSDPIITRNSYGTLWVDADYIAYQLGTGEIQYVYCSRFEQLTTYETYRQAKRRNKDFSLGEDVRGNMTMITVYWRYVPTPIWISDEIKFTWFGEKGARYRAYAVHSMNYDWRKAAVRQKERLEREYIKEVQEAISANTVGNAGSAAQLISAERTGNQDGEN